MRGIYYLGAAALVSTGIPYYATGAVFFLEAEDFVGQSGVTVQTAMTNNPLIDPNFPSTPMSGNAYVSAPHTSYMWYHMPAGSVPAGTYYIAERGYSVSTHPRGVQLAYAYGLVSGATSMTELPAITLNTVNNNNNAYEWKKAYTSVTSSTVATFTVPANTDITLRVTSVASSTAFPDVFGFFGLGTALPSNSIPTRGSYTPQPWGTISETGGARATAYPGANKIITTGSGVTKRTHVAWVDYIGDGTRINQGDGSRLMYRAYEHATQTWTDAVDLGDSYDNHGGASLALDAGGRLVMVYGAHQTSPYNAAITTPFKFRRMVDASNSMWGPEETIVDNSVPGGTIDYDPTYPSVVADQNDPEKLHLVFRGDATMPHGIEYFRREVNAQQIPEWKKIHSLVEPTNSPNLYTEFTNALAMGSTGTLHLAYQYYKEIGVSVYDANHIGYMKSTDGGDTWTNAAGTTLALPTLADSGPALVTTLPNSEFAIGSIDADSSDNPWFTALDRRHKTFDLYHHDGSAWQTIDLASALLALNGDFNVVSDSQISISDVDDTIRVIASYALDSDVWGDPTCEVALLTSTDGGLNWFIQQLSPTDASTANWSVMIERGVGNNFVDTPMMMYSHGNYYDQFSDVRFIDGSDLSWADGIWWSSALGIVPEPSCLALVATGVPLLLRRRRSSISA